MQYIRNLFAKQSPTLLSWPICISMYLMLIITPLGTNTKTLSRPISRPDVPGRLGGNGLERNRRQLQLLCEDSCIIKVSAIRAKYADIFEKQTTFLSWTWRINGIQYVKVDIRTNKPLNSHFRFRLSYRLCYRYRQQTRFFKSIM